MHALTPISNLDSSVQAYKHNKHVFGLREETGVPVKCPPRKAGAQTTAVHIFLSALWDLTISWRPGRYRLRCDGTVEEILDV